MTSATDELRRLLDERGVKYRFNESTKVFEWHFEGTDGEGSAHATKADGGINIMACSLTPEQAIDATLGRGTCRDTALEGEWFECSECGTVKQLIHPQYCPNCGARCVG